jgi:Family of unknown function (DUF6428)
MTEVTIYHNSNCGTSRNVLALIRNAGVEPKIVEYQLWDIPPEDDRGLMPVAKFLAIIGKVSDAIPFDPRAKVTFEVSDGQAAMRLYRVAAIDIDSDVVRVELTQRPASCKPRDRWLEPQQSQSSQCCGSTTAKPCCN